MRFLLGAAFDLFLCALLVVAFGPMVLVVAALALAWALHPRPA